MMNAASTNPPPWWRFGIVWLVVGGPAAVVVAATLTAVIAFRYADPVVSEAPVPVHAATSDAPALQARNHAATARP